VIPQSAIKTIFNLWPMITLMSVVLITVRLTYLIVNHKKISIYNELISFFFIIYIMLLFELVTSTDFESFSNNFIPFKEIFRYSLTSKLFYRNVIGNIILFIPFGYFISYYCKLNKWYLSFLISLITSFTIETIQMGIGRSFDVDDIILNVLGGLIGYIFYAILKKYNDKFKNSLLLNFICIIIIIVLSLIILSLYGVVL
jgi:glycopeptide antibiotics resistance protein